MLSAAAQQLDLAQYIIGCAHFQGLEDFDLDHEEAVRWLTLAANQGLCEAMSTLGQVYFCGCVPVEDDDYVPSCGPSFDELVSRLHASGREFVTNRDESIKWFLRALNVVDYSSSESHSSVWSLLQYHGCEEKELVDFAQALGLSHVIERLCADF